MTEDLCKEYSEAMNIMNTVGALKSTIDYDIARGVNNIRKNRKLDCLNDIKKSIKVIENEINKGDI